MSDEPPSYFLNGVELLGFRREPLMAPGEVSKGKNARRREYRLAHSKKNRLHMRDGNLCHYCKVVLRGPNPSTIEHVVPRSLGGNNEVYNLVLACEPCNTGFGSQYIKCECGFCKNARFMHQNN